MSDSYYMKNPFFTLSGFAMLLAMLSCAHHARKERTQYPKDDQLSPTNTGSRLEEIIAFGSCNKHDQPQPLWEAILENDPGLWVWTGDIVYGDTKDMHLLRKKYDAQRMNEGYQQLLKQCQAIGTWDDHDYGTNNGGKEYIAKSESKFELLRFLNIPYDHPSRKRDGVYQTYLYAFPDNKVRIVLFDTRYFRDQPGPDADILGDDQWQWLDSLLQRRDADVYLFVSSIQFVPEDHPYEKWGNFPKAKQRMLDLLVRHQIPHPVMLSGDRHLAEISKMEVAGLEAPLYDITASGMTHSWEGADEPNRFRVSALIGQKNFGLIRFTKSADGSKMSLEIRGLANKLLAKEAIKL